MELLLLRLLRLLLSSFELRINLLSKLLLPLLFIPIGLIRFRHLIRSLHFWDLKPGSILRLR